MVSGLLFFTMTAEGFHLWCVEVFTWAERGDVICSGKVQCGSRDVHHLVIVVVAGVMEAVESAATVSGVFHNSRGCLTTTTKKEGKERRRVIWLPAPASRAPLPPTLLLKTSANYLCPRRGHNSDKSSPKTGTLNLKVEQGASVFISPNTGGQKDEAKPHCAYAPLTQWWLHSFILKEVTTSAHFGNCISAV